MDHQEQQLLLPHVLIFPLPIQSPVNSMLKLAELLCLAGLHVTFLNTKHNHKRILNCTNIQSRVAQYEGRFRLEMIEDGLPEEHPRSVEQFGEILDSLENVAKPFLRDVLQGGSCSAGRLPVTCVIADGLYGYAVEIAEEMKIPPIVFETIGPSCLWVYLCIPKLIETGQLPSQGDDLDTQVTNIPGMEGCLRRRDLPDFCRRDCTADRNAQLAIAEALNIPRLAGLILNTFEALDGPFLSHIRSAAPNLYAIGPLQLLLKKRLAANETAELRDLSNSFWMEDRNCISWLDSQPSKSVIYISFGSMKNITKDEFLEFWHGIKNSGQRFLWVIRPGSVKGQELEHDYFLKELNSNTKERGLIASWVPQEVVLAHPSIGAFLTHSGWNSTLESIIAGVPMVCWPHYVDQLVTSRFVSKVWKLGLDMKDTCDRKIVELMVREVMEERNDEFHQSADELSRLAKDSVVEGGSSDFNLDRLVADIKKLSLKGVIDGRFIS